MMKIYYLMVILTCIEAKKTLYCDVVTYNSMKRCFLKETLTNIPHSPNQLAVDDSTNILYFSFDFGHGEYVPALFHIDTKNINILKGVKDAFAIASDNIAGEYIYFGGSHGIYKYNPVVSTLQRLNFENLDIWWLVVKKHIYFIKFPSLNVYYYESRTIKPVPHLRGLTIHQFVLDKDDNIFFLNGTGLFGVKNDSNAPILIRGYPKFVALGTDKTGTVYVCGEDGIYIMQTMIHKVKKYINIPGVLGLTFDRNNNLIYSNSHEIVRLVTVQSDDEVQYIVRPF